MPGSPGHPIVRRALDLLMELPDKPALQILDHAMQGHEGDVDFENDDTQLVALFGDYLDPPSPFSELIRRAFAPKLDPHAWLLLALLDCPEDAGCRKQWNAAAGDWAQATAAFAKRYKLWGC